MSPIMYHITWDVIRTFNLGFKTLIAANTLSFFKFQSETFFLEPFILEILVKDT